jgi:hypothetical protein
MKWFRREKSGGEVLTNTPPTLDGLLPNTAPTKTRDLLHSLSQSGPFPTWPSTLASEERHALHEKKMQSISNSIAGLTSVAECERDQYGRFAPRRFAPRPPAAEPGPAVDEPPPAWWMAL